MKNYFLICFAPILASCVLSTDLHAEKPFAPGSEDRPNVGEGYHWVPVSGVGTHYFSTAIVHSVQPTATGFIQRSSETVELEGDLVGRVLYHPVSEFDFAAGTLTNTGNQVFSGTVLGSSLVLLHDDQFHVEVNLINGTTYGQMYLFDRLGGAKTRCQLELFGVGQQTPEGDAIVDYFGHCLVASPQASRPIEP